MWVCFWTLYSLLLSLQNSICCFHSVFNSWYLVVKLLSRVWLCDPTDCSLPGSTVHGILQARILEWVAISFSRRSSWPRDWTWVSRIVGRCFTIWATREVPGYLVVKATKFIPDYTGNFWFFGFSCNCRISLCRLSHIFSWTGPHLLFSNVNSISKFYFFTLSLVTNNVNIICIF